MGVAVADRVDLWRERGGVSVLTEVLEEGFREERDVGSSIMGTAERRGADRVWDWDCGCA